MILTDSNGFKWISKDSKGFQWVSNDLIEFHSISVNFTGLQKEFQKNLKLIWFLVMVLKMKND